VCDGVRAASIGDAFDDPAASQQFDASMRQIYVLAGEPGPMAPWTHPRASEWGSENVSDVDHGARPHARGSRGRGGKADVTDAPPEASFFRALTFVPALGDVIVLNSHVGAIVQPTNGVRVTSARAELDAAAVIVALAPR
jgi:hypothetical protein